MGKRQRRELVAALSVLVVTAGLLTGARLTPHSWLAGLDLPLYDRLVAQVPLDARQIDAVTVIEIDDDTLARLGERWPLPRMEWARFLKVLQDYGPTAVGIDAWFEVPAPRRHVELAQEVADQLRDAGLADSGPGLELAQQLEERAALEDGDRQMSRAMAELGSVVLGMVCQSGASMQAAHAGQAAAAVLRHPDLPPTLPRQCERLATSIPPFVVSAREQAGLNLLYDIDGAVRRYPYAFSADGKPYPNLALALARLARPARAEALTGRALRADAGGPLLHFVPRERFQRLSFADVTQAEAGNPGLTTALKGRVVLVGATAAGTASRIRTPGELSVPTVYAHASATLALLDDALIRSSGTPVTLALSLGSLWLLLLLILGARVSRAAAVVAIGAGSILAWTLVTAALLSQGWWTGGTPLAAGFALWTASRLLLDRRAMRETLGRYVTDAVAEELLDRRGGAELGGKVQTVTILMSDLRGFTRMSARLGPERTVALLNRYLGRMTEVIVAHDGTINEFIGDAILALFGAPVARPDDAARAVACAAAMQRALVALNAESEAMGIERLQMGIGLDTGPVVAGNIGSEQRAKYGVVGEAVNMASRIESLTVGSQVLLSHLTRGQVVDADVRVHGPVAVRVKGRAEPLQVYELRSVGGVEVPGSAAGALAPVEATAWCQPLAGKVVEEDEAFEGRISGLNDEGALLEASRALCTYDDVLVQVRDARGQKTGDIYAKVGRVTCEEADRYAMRLVFTSLEPADRAVLGAICARGPAAVSPAP